MTQTDIEGLMREGLDHYAMGDDAKAIACWQRVLELEPGHAEAQDYLRTASGDEQGDAPEAQPETAPPAQGSLLETATEMLQNGAFGDALEMLETLAQKDPANLAVEGRLELVRVRMLDEYRKRLCDGIAVPQLCIDSQEVLKYNLPADAGFLLSSIDGATSVSDLVQVSGLDPFEVMRICCRLLDAKIIEVHP